MVRFNFNPTYQESVKVAIALGDYATALAEKKKVKKPFVGIRKNQLLFNQGKAISYNAIINISKKILKTDFYLEANNSDQLKRDITNSLKLITEYEESTFFSGFKYFELKKANKLIESEERSDKRIVERNIGILFPNELGRRQKIYLEDKAKIRESLPYVRVSKRNLKNHVSVTHLFVKCKEKITVLFTRYIRF